ncbi:MAG: alpha/beta hydrolase, partial [Flavitalea sp.]
MKKLIILAITWFSVMPTIAQKEFPLYPKGVPGAIPSPNEESSAINEDSVLIVSKVSVPTLTVYYAPPPKANGSAVIICPGGGYSILASGHEGADVARRFNEMGVTAFVLKYRIPNDKTMVNKEIGPIQDAQQAISMVRSHARKWGVRKDRIGIMGFSAGGHLASTAGTHF